MTEREMVRPDGTSPLVPAGIQDLAALGDNIELDKEIEEKVNSILAIELNREEEKARFKLEVVFSEQVSRREPYAGFVFAWTNGGFAHGGGDEVVYFCSAKVQKGEETKTCAAPIDLKFVSREHAICPTCRNVINPKELVGQVFAKLPSQHWATLLTRMFLLLGANADIRMGFMPGDLRGASTAELEKPRQGEILNKVRTRRHWVRYPLTEIIKDTSNGASLYRRLRAFLEA